MTKGIVPPDPSGRPRNTGAPTRLKFDLNERITDRLRDLVAKYPKGLGIVKEFLQNADDAGASELRVIYDRRHHRGQLDDSEMNVALGPALLMINDRPFTPDDLVHIQSISDSSKRTDAGRTGRFGQGFSTAYSVSDAPSLLTGDHLVWFDPHRRILERDGNAIAWSLASAAATWPAWVATFAPAGVAIDGSPFPGTVFRLPVRSPAEAPRSEIRKDPFTEEDWEKIIAEARAAGPALLVFLRSVVKLEIYDVVASGRKVLRLAVRTRNSEAVTNARRPLRNVVAGRPIDLLQEWINSESPLPAAEYAHEFEVCAAGTRTEVEKWEVVSQLSRGPGNVLLKAAAALCEADEKVLPWSGAAARREGAWSSPKGGFACFLPLPEAGASPVWLHGSFALDSSARRSLARVPVEDHSKRQVEWNRHLMKHGVGPAWARLMLRMRADAASCIAPYERWPEAARPGNDVDAACVAGFYEAVKELPVFRGRVGDLAAWYDGQTRVISLPAQWQQRLEPPLSQTTVPVLTPALPAHVRMGLELSSGGPRTLTVEDVRRALLAIGSVNHLVSDAPKKWLARSEWVVAIAAFCRTEGLDKLAGLPLALLANGMLRNFDRADPVYIVRASDETLMEPFSHRALNSDFVESVLEGRPVPAIGACTLEARALVRLARELTETDVGPSAPWLQAFFERLEQAPHVDIVSQGRALKELALVPDTEGNLHHPGTWSTPLLANQGDPVARAIGDLGIALVGGGPDLTAAIEKFARRHQGFVWTTSAQVVAVVMVARSSELDWSACDEGEVLEPILDLLANLRLDKLETSTAREIRRLPILPTSSGERVSADAADVYMLAAFRPPALVGGELHFIDTSSRPAWREFFARLGVPEMDGRRFVTDVVLPSFGTVAPSTRDALLMWLRDEIQKIEVLLEDKLRKDLAWRVRSTSILPVASGELVAPTRLYSPDANVEPLLGDLARKPDVSRFTDDPERWRRFFDWLRLAHDPRPTDLHAAVISIVEKSSRLGVEQVSATLQRLIEYVGDRWKSLEMASIGADATLGDALAELAWMPAKHLASHECPGAMPPERRLYSPSELADNSIRDLVASQLLILDGDIPADMAKALGITRQPALEHVLAHFGVLRSVPTPDTARERSAVRSAFRAIVRHLGANRDYFSALRDEYIDSEDACVLIGLAWREPRCVFLQPLATALRGASSVHDDPELALWSAEGTSARAGLELLGVRSSPGHEDWLISLQEIAAENGNAALSVDAIKLVNGALRELSTAEDAWLRKYLVPVPTQDGCLVAASEAFLPGDPRLREPMVTRLPVVVDIQDICDLAKRAGAVPLYDALEDSIHQETHESIDPVYRAWCEGYETRLRSDAFASALSRLAHQQELQNREDPIDEAEFLARLSRVRHMQIVVAERVRVESRLIRAPKSLVFDLEVASFTDERRGKLWLAMTSDRRQHNEVVRALSRLTRVGDTLLLSRLLECEPSDMKGMLDEDGIVPEVQRRNLELDDVAMHNSELAMALVAVPSRDTEGSTAGLEDAFKVPEPNDTLAIDSSLVGVEVSSSGTGWTRDIDPWGPRHLTSGNSRPWSIDHPVASRHVGWGGRRLRAYLHSHSQTDYDVLTGAGTARESSAEAVAVVSARLSSDGDVVVPADAALDGYNLMVGEGDCKRFYRVIGVEGRWTSLGIPLSRRDIEAAVREGDRWSVCVVEHMDDPNRREVHEIANPIHSAHELRLDDSWRTVSLNVTSAEPVVGESVTLEDGRRATIASVETFGAIVDVELQFESGERVNMVWQSHWKRGN